MYFASFNLLGRGHQEYASLLYWERTEWYGYVHFDCVDDFDEPWESACWEDDEPWDDDSQHLPW